MVSIKIASVIISASAAVLLTVFFAPSLFLDGIPRVIVDEEVDIPPGESVATGNIEYVVTLNFEDGSKKTFTEKVSIGELPLNSITAGGKKVTSIEADAFATIKLPQNIDPSVTKTMYVESNANVLLNGQSIGGKNTNTFWSFDQLQAGKVHLYHISVPATSVNLVTGTYTLSLDSADSIRFVVDGQNRISVVKASPTFGIENVNGILKEIYVISHSPAAVASLERDPLRAPDGEIRSYNSTINIRAEGFKANSPITFTYVDRSASPPSYDPANQRYSVLLGKGQVVLQSDLMGKATDITIVRVGFSAPDANDYYAHFIVSDEENFAYGKAGRSWREVRGYGENPGFNTWPACVGSWSANPCVTDTGLINQIIAAGGGRYPV